MGNLSLNGPGRQPKTERTPNSCSFYARLTNREGRFSCEGLRIVETDGGKAFSRRPPLHPRRNGSLDQGWKAERLKEETVAAFTLPAFQPFSFLVWLLP